MPGNPTQVESRPPDGMLLAQRTWGYAPVAMTTPRKHRIANPIAVRRFTVAGEPDREVVLTIGKPRPDPKPGGAWMCSVLIEGIPREQRPHVYGVDAIQALQLAFTYARHELDGSGLSLTWLDPHAPGDIGLPFSAPSTYGVYFQRRIEHYIERQELELGAALTAILHERARGRAASGPSKE
jgi:hypothetical protein